MKQLYVIAGCNGVGKTTASYTILPEILDCKEFVNADEIAKGLSPFQPESANIQAGRLMLIRIKSLLERGENFAFETTLSTKSHAGLIQHAKNSGYAVTLLLFWLNSTDLAIKRVKTRVIEGGHSIPENVIIRRYHRGLRNFFKIFRPIVDDWLLIDNSGEPYQIIAEGTQLSEDILNKEIWTSLQSSYHDR